MAPVMLRCFSLSSCLLMMIQVSLGGSVSGSNLADKKVSLDLYYESLCPYCANFIVNELPAIFENGLIDIVDIKFYPWGNAKIRPDNSIACQHGPNECLLNEIDACAVEAWPTLSGHFPFIYCVESLVYEDRSKYKQWETCFEKLKLDPKPVTDCYSSGYGQKLVLEYAAETNALQPPHTYVPWVVVDGQPLYEDYENFIDYICKAYKGSPPNACAEASLGNALKKKTNDAHPICYTDEIVKNRIRSSMGSWIQQVISEAAM